MNELIDIALSQYGTLEIPGSEDNPAILNYFKEIGHEWVRDDETAWCSAFVNWVALKGGVERSGKLDARSWLKVGEPQINWKLGDVVIYWRESKRSWKGHIGFPIREADGVIWTLGGNQGNQVKIAPYPSGRVLGFRRLKRV